MIGAFTQQIDLAQVLVGAFILFFFGLVLYIRREDKREGYPLEEVTPQLNHRIVGFPEPPPPKRYALMHGGSVTLPQEYARRDLNASVRERSPGAPIYPTGDPLLAGVGPGAYTLRRDEPFLMHDGSRQLAPLRDATDHHCVDPERDPRGLRMYGDDYVEVGTVTDVWIDKGSKILRYLEVALDGEPKHRLVPIFYAQFWRKTKSFKLDCLSSTQFAKAPILRHPDIVTAREEDRINGFYAGGYMYSTPLREALP